MKDLLKAARRAGLAGVAISDHNSVKGAAEALTLAKRYGLVVVPAVEVSTDSGHILAYGVPVDAPPGRGRPPEETVEEIHALGGIAVVAHPYRTYSGLGPSATRRVRSDGVEASNGRSWYTGNRRAAELARELHRGVTGGSDAHSLEEVGKAYTVAPSFMSAEELVDAVRKRRTRAGGTGLGLTSAATIGKRKVAAWVGRGMRRI